MNLPDFSSLLSGPENVFWFFLGIALTRGWQIMKCKYKDHTDPDHTPHKLAPINWLYIAIASTIIITVAIGVQNQQTYTFATRLAEETRQCQVEFFGIVKNNSEIAKEDRRLADVQRKAIADWLNDIVLPPESIASLPPDDEHRYEWGIARTQTANRILLDAQFQQKQLEEERERHPYPDPTCGR